MMNELIRCDDWQAGDGLQVGDDVVIECQYARIGDNVRIGVHTDANFRRLSGVRIKVAELVLGDGVVIDRETLLQGGSFQLDKGVRILGGSTLRVKESLHVQPHGTVNENCEVSGVDIEIGRRLWMLPFAKIGGGSAFEVHSRLRAGHFCHLGAHTFLNTARPVTLGDEVGLGTRTALYTHGAYPSVLQGAPVAWGGIHIGGRSWLPGAVVNPGVSIGPDCVIGVGAVVTRDIPAGSLAAGVPARVIRENAYPQELSPEQKRAIMTALLRGFAEICQDRHRVEFAASDNGKVLMRLDDKMSIVYNFLASAGWADALQDSVGRVIYLAHEYERWPGAFSPDLTLIDLDARRIAGKADDLSERLLNQLRRYGVRFRYEPEGGAYVAW